MIAEQHLEDFGDLAAVMRQLVEVFTHSRLGFGEFAKRHTGLAGSVPAALVTPPVCLVVFETGQRVASAAVSVPVAVAVILDEFGYILGNVVPDLQLKLMHPERA